MKYSVCVVTGSRAEFGLLKPLLVKLQNDNEFSLQLVVTGSHLANEFGNTVSDIELSGIQIYRKISIPLSGDTKYDMANSTGAAIQHFADYFKNNMPDVLVVLGDRFEIFAACSAAALMGINIAHIHGGETTEGAVDESLRHSITKMSYIHFTACEEYRKRVVQLGENPQRVFNVGALGVENIMSLSEIPLCILCDELVFDLMGDFAIVTFHPVTLESFTAERQLNELVDAMDQFTNMSFVITKANADAGGRRINQIWDELAVTHPNWKVVSSLGSQKYLNVLKNAKMIIGNSSSGIIEAPALHIPTVNIGERQKGRMMADSIVSCEPTSVAIVEAMHYVLSEKFKKVVERAVCPFGNGETSLSIINQIKIMLSQGKTENKKKFYDVDFHIVD